MILTGKAQGDFEKWLCKEDNLFIEEIKEMSNYIDERYLNALIIEWLDSVGIFIELYKYDYFVTYIVHGDITEKGWDESDAPSETRQEAIEKAIVKANKIYNERMD